MIKKLLWNILPAFLPLILSAQKIEFNYYEIGRFGSKMGQTSLVDVDNDNDLDWVFGRFGHMYWYEFHHPEKWTLHEIGKGARTDVGGCPYDVNADGWIDFIAGDSWYENTANPKKEYFRLHKKNMIGSHDNIVADLDGDGIKDVISCSDDLRHTVLAWYKVPADKDKNWDYHKIGPGIHGGIAPAGAADLDNDGDIDIVRGNHWYKNEQASVNWWTEHKTLIPPGGNRPDIYGLALRTWCTDLDDDGDIDIIEAEADTPNGRVFWFENMGNASDFVYHPISEDSTGQDFHSLAVADFDNDGDSDVLSGGGPLSSGERKLIIRENISAKNNIWKKHIVLSGIRIHEAVAADVDQDGDIDICSKPWDGDLHIFMENLLVK